MKMKRFKAEILGGHKDHAVAVPFDPTEVWGTPAQPLWRGRKGRPVSGTLNRTSFAESFIVPRARKFFLIIDKEMMRDAGVSVGDSVSVAVKPKVDRGCDL